MPIRQPGVWRRDDKGQLTPLSPVTGPARPTPAPPAAPKPPPAAAAPTKAPKKQEVQV